jgi:uncharacterized membrane protein
MEREGRAMKQEAFIQKLQHELGGLSKQAVDEIVADYREYIGDALSAGRREEEIIAALGDPVKLGRELKAQANYRQWEQRRSFGNLARVVASIAGLGLLHIFLLLPFMLYLLLLTAAYALSSALIVAGLVAALGLGSYHVFGWPGLKVLPFITSGGSGNVSVSRQAEGAANPLSDEKPETRIRDVKVTDDRLVFSLQDGERLSIVTPHGPIDVRKHGQGMDMDAPFEAARRTLTQESDGSLSIAKSDVVALDFKGNGNGRLSLARTGKNPGEMIWDVTTDDGDHLSFGEDLHGNASSVTAQSGSDSVVINDHQISVDDDHDHIHIAAPPGSTLTHLALGYALAMLIGGLVGLALCVWLTRVTWRAVVRYLKRQMERVSASLDNSQAA